MDALNFTTEDEAVKLISLLAIATRILPTDSVVRVKPALNMLLQFKDYINNKKVTLNPMTVSWMSSRNLLTPTERTRLCKLSPIPIDSVPVPNIRLTPEELEMVANEYAIEVDYHHLVDSLPLELNNLYGNTTRVRMVGPTFMQATIGVVTSYSCPETANVINGFVKAMQKINPVLLEHMPGVKRTTYGLSVRWYNLAIIIPIAG
jgi:hypothetical protein